MSSETITHASIAKRAKKHESALLERTLDYELFSPTFEIFCIFYVNLISYLMNIKLTSHSIIRY